MNRNIKNKTTDEGLSEPSHKTDVIGSAFKGTQGKWKVIEIELFDYSNCAVGNDKTSVCHLFYEGVKITNEAKANAKLIAAAPDLLEALQQLQKVVYKLSDEYSIPYKKIRNENELAVSAISKALNG